MVGFLVKIEDRPTPSQVYNYRVYASAIIACFAALAIGYDSSFIGTSLTLPSFVDEFNFNSYPESNLAKLKSDIVSVYQAGGFFGSLSAYVTSHFFGRKKSIFGFTFFFLVGAAIMCGASGDRGLSLIIGGRVLAGLGVGGCSSMVPIYISEISPPAIRGRLVGMWEVAWQFGGLVGFWINYGVNETLPANHTQWLIPFAVQLIPTGILFAGMFFVPESPRWLLANGQRDKGIRTLCWLRNLGPTEAYILEEIILIDTDTERLRREVGVGFWKPFRALRDRSVQWRFLLGGLLFLWQNGTGINAINYYSPTVFQSMGIDSTTTNLLATGVFGAVKSVECLLWAIFIVDRFGRRNVLMFGAVGGSVCMWIIGAYIKIANPGANSHGTITSGGIAAIFFFYLWTVPYQFSWSGTPWVVNAEIFDFSTRSLGQASAAANNWFWNFIISRFTPQMFLSMGYGVYFFFASMMILSSIFVYIFLPETSNIPLESIDRLFSIKPVGQANKILLEQLRAEDQELRRTGEVTELKGNMEQIELFNEA